MISEQGKYSYGEIRYELKEICQLNKNNQSVDFDVEYSKLFLTEVKKCSRLNASISKLAEQAIINFNQLFPNHQVLHQIQFPL
jgi:hypothetical protein